MMETKIIRKLTGFFSLLLMISLFSLCQAAPEDSAAQADSIGKAVDKAIGEMKKDDPEAQKKGIKEIRMKALMDIDGIETKKANVVLREILKDHRYDEKRKVKVQKNQIAEVVIGGPRIEAIQTLCFTGDENDTLELRMIAKLNRGIFCNGETEFYTDAGYAKKAIYLIKLRKTFFDNYYTRTTDSEKIAYLISAMKKIDYNAPSNDNYFISIIQKLFVRIGKEAVPALCGILEEAGTIYENTRNGIKAPIYTSVIYRIVPPALGEIGDKRAIPSLEKLRSIIKGCISEPILSQAISKINSKK